MSIDLFEPRTMIAAVERMKPPKTFLRDTFFGQRRTSTQETVEVHLKKGQRRMAPFVSPVIGGKVVDREGYTVTSYRPPLIAPRRITTAEDVQNRQFGENLYDGLDPDQRAAQILGRDMAELDDIITRREEWMCAQALFAGEIHMVGEGVDQVISFNHTLREVLDAADQWTADTSDPIADLDGWRKEILKACGIAPHICIVAADVVMPLVTHATVRDSMDKTKIALGRIDPQLLPNGVTYLGTITLLGIDVYSYIDWYIDDATGVEKPMVPDGFVLLGSTRAEFELVYGAYTDLKTSTTYAVPRYPRSWAEEGPNQRYLEMDSRPLPIPMDVDSWYIADVM